MGNAAYYWRNRAKILTRQRAYQKRRYAKRTGKLYKATLSPEAWERKLAKGKKHWRKYSRRIRLEVLSHYGGAKCFCCAEANDRFLTLDHSRNDGAKWRKRMARAHRQNQLGKRYLQGVNFYLWLRRRKFPQNLGLRVACYNCNLGRSRNDGVCPHNSP